MKPARLIGSLKFRFVALFTLFIVVLCAAISYFSIVDAVKMVSDVFALSGVAIAEKAAKAVDGDSFEKLAQSLDPDDPFYEETRLKLLAIKNETSCEFLYTMAPYRGTVYRFIVDGSAPPDDEENFSALGDEDDVSGYDPAFMECWEKRATVYSGLQYQEGWGWMISIYAPILNSRGNMVGIVGCDYEGESLYIEIRRGIMRQIAIALVFLAAGFGLMVFFLKMIFGRLAILNSLLREISAGEGDFTRRIAALSSDEIGELVGHFNNTMEKLMFLVAGVKDRSASLSISGNELNEDINNVSVAIGEIVSDIATLRERVISQSASATETSATMEQMSRNIDRLNTNVEMQAASVVQSSAAVEEMLANVRSVAQTLAGNAENVGELIKTSEMGRTGLENVSRDIQEIARESEGLLEINSVMENIASQTNLLAMNAAIEAAHAGEAGRGFAVVADEIRKLAVNSSDQSRIIADVLKKIKASIDQITVSAGTVMQEFQAIDGLVRTVSDQEEHIRNAMDEQGQGSQQILAAVGKMNDLSQQVKAGSSEMLEGSKEVIRESKSLETVTQKISGEISRMAANADRINQAALRVDDASRANKRHIDAMASEVSKFKVE